MRFQVGQIVQCKLALIPGHAKLVNCVGEIKEVFDPLTAFIFLAEYVVYFPNFPEGLCPYCDKHHNPLHFLMMEKELKPVDDPDQGKVDHTDEKLPEEIEA